MDSVVLSSDSLSCEFSPQTGALIRLRAPKIDWNILDRPELGLNWRLMVPLSEELRNNDILGEKQALTFWEQNGGQITFVWDGVESERGGHLNIRLTLIVRAEGSQLVYTATIENHSPYTVENVYCPYLGDVQPPEGATYLKSFHYHYNRGVEYNIWPKFTNTEGYFGVDYPTQMWDGMHIGAPMAPFCLIRSETEGLYAGVKTPSAELVTWVSELRPGYGSSIDQSAPTGREIAGKPVHTLFAALHIPYILPGETRTLTPVALEAYQGDWHAGVDIYKNWRQTWMKPAVAPEWAREPHAWQQLHINSPEDELRTRFTDLPKVAEECKRHGVKAIQLVGWNDGGQDQGNPSHDPDPRLGTFEELREAITRCHEIGVKVILFTKFIWADRGTKWFRDELINYVIKDPYGDYYMHGGYKYFTGTQLCDINTKRLIPMDFACGPYLKICEQEFQKVVDLGAAGMLFDECCHHGPALLNFNAAFGGRYGAPVYANDREFIYRLRQVPGTPSDFLMSGEACYDWQMEAYHLSYHRSEEVRHIPLSRYMLPHAQYMTAVTGFNDRNMIDQCLMYRYIISYEPYNFKGRLDDFPDTMRYGEQMDALRTEYRKWFWDGEFRDTCGAKVIKQNGEPHILYSVFLAEDKSVGLVIVNYEDEPVVVTAEAEGHTLSKYRLVDGEGFLDIEDGIKLPAQSAAVAL